MSCAAVSLTISRSRRRTRLRSTALPTFLDAVNPTRTGPPTLRSSACNTNAAVTTLTPPAAARKSVRRRNRSMKTRWTRSGAEPLAALRAARGKDPTAALGRHARAETVTALAHQLARLIGPLHGSFSAQGGAPPNNDWRDAGSVPDLPDGGPPRPNTAFVGIAGLCNVPRLIREAALARQCEQGAWAPPRDPTTSRLK